MGRGHLLLGVQNLFYSTSMVLNGSAKCDLFCFVGRQLSEVENILFCFVGHPLWEVDNHWSKLFSFTNWQNKSKKHFKKS